MGKFSRHESYSQRKPRPWKIHPVWRGLGCLLLVIVPVMAYAGATLLVEANFRTYHWVPILPPEFRGPQSNPLLYANLAVALILTILGFVLLFVIYSIVYSIMGPPRYGPTDAPPARRRPPRRR